MQSTSRLYASHARVTCKLGEVLCNMVSAPAQALSAPDQCTAICAVPECRGPDAWSLPESRSAVANTAAGHQIATCVVDEETPHPSHPSLPLRILHQATFAASVRGSDAPFICCILQLTCCRRPAAPAAGIAVQNAACKPSALPVSQPGSRCSHTDSGDGLSICGTAEPVAHTSTVGAVHPLPMTSLSINGLHLHAGSTHCAWCGPAAQPQQPTGWIPGSLTAAGAAMTAAATASRRRRRHQPQPAQQRELSAAACCASSVLPVHGGNKDVAEYLCTTMECRRTQEQIESEALPESFCIIESRDSVKVLRCGCPQQHTSDTHEVRKGAQCRPCASVPL